MGDCRLNLAVIRDAKDKESKTRGGKKVVLEVEMKRRRHTNGQVTDDKRERAS